MPVSVRWARALVFSAVTLAGGSTRADDFLIDQLSDALRQPYAGVMQMVGASLELGTDGFEIALRRFVRAAIAARPEGCTDAMLLQELCGLRPLRVPSTAMEPSLVQGEFLFSVPVSVSRPLRRGDVIAFRSERGNAVHMMRIIGLPEERVEIIQGRVLVNGANFATASTGETISSVVGEPLDVHWETTPEGRRYRTARSRKPALAMMDDSPGIIVPAGSYYVLGDNRHNAADSRFPESFGSRFVAADRVLGRIVIVYGSKNLDRIGLQPN